MTHTFHTALRYSPREGRVILLEEPEASRQTVLRSFDPAGGSWQTRRVDGLDTADIAFAGDQLWHLSPAGVAWFQDPEGRIHEQPLPDPGVFMARANALAHVANRLYACGLARVCEHRDGTWHHVGAPFKSYNLTERNTDLVSLDGTSDRDLYAVGGRLLAHWDGSTWSRVALPAFAGLGRLNRVRCVAPGRVNVVGHQGMILELGDGGWTASQLPGFAALTPLEAMGAYELSDVTSFRDVLYVIDREHIFQRRDEDWTLVEHGFAEDGKNDFIRLEVGGGRLWVLGSQRLFSFDGSAWTLYADPEHR